MDSIGTLTPERFIDQSEKYLELLNTDEEVRKSIPLISSLKSYEQLKDAQLVRFRGLIQDMQDPEIYLETYQTKDANNTISTHKGKYRDNLKLKENETILFDSSQNVHEERRPMFMVSVPALNDWASGLEAERFPKSEHMEVSDDAPKADNTSEEKATETAMETENETPQSKKVKTSNDTSSNNSCLSSEYLLNSPIAERPSSACLAKFYEDKSNFSLNDVVEVVGFVSLGANLCGSKREPDEFESFNEVCAMNPPPSLIPRIHVISYRSLRHLNPMLYDNDSSSNCATQNDQQKLDSLKYMRKVLAQCLFGDEIAADYLLCHMISTVYVRGDETLGQFSLNLTNVPIESQSSYIKQLYEIIELCLPASHYFPVTVDNLNTINFVPTKDYETGKLTSGLLQLAPHTHLVLDETCLQQGKLQNKGVEAVVQLSNLIRNQKLNVDFKFYTIDYNANVPVLILSEGKSMFPSNCHVPLNLSSDPDAVQHINETFAATKQFLKPKLNAIRQYLTEMRLQEFDMEPSSMEMIQKDFIEMRREFNAGAEDLHAMLVLSRMLGILHGKSTLDAESWQYAKQMERERRSRINTKTNTKPA